MRLLWILALTVGVRGQFSFVDKQEYDDVECSALEEEVAELKRSQAAAVRQAILQQLYLEERVRSEGDSGVKQVGVTINAEL